MNKKILHKLIKDMYHKHNNFQSFFMNKTSLISNSKEIKKTEIKIDIYKKSPTTKVVGLLKGRRHTLPMLLSTICADRLNFSVRNGKR